MDTQTGLCTRRTQFWALTLSSLLHLLEPAGSNVASKLALRTPINQNHPSLPRCPHSAQKRLLRTLELFSDGFVPHHSGVLRM